VVFADLLCGETKVRGTTSSVGYTGVWGDTKSHFVAKCQGQGLVWYKNLCSDLRDKKKEDIQSQCVN
jgi:hypothetical protein